MKNTLKLGHYDFFKTPIIGLLLDKIYMFVINELQSKNLNDISISKCFETNINKIFIKELSNVNEPIYVSNQSDNINEDKRLEYIQKYKRIYINIDAKGVKHGDNDSKYDNFHFSNSQTSIQNFYGNRRNGIPFNISGKQEPMIYNKLNLTFVIKGIWSNNLKYKYDKIHLYCIPNGLYFNDIKPMINPKNYPKNIDDGCEIRLKIQQLPNNYYSEILI